MKCPWCRKDVSEVKGIATAFDELFYRPLDGDEEDGELACPHCGGTFTWRLVARVEVDDYTQRLKSPEQVKRELDPEHPLSTREQRIAEREHGQLNILTAGGER